MTLTSRFLKAIFKGFVFLVIVQFSRYRCAFSQKCLSIISHFFSFVKRFLKYFFISFPLLDPRSSGDLFILPQLRANVKPFFDVLPFTHNRMKFANTYVQNAFHLAKSSLIPPAKCTITLKKYPKLCALPDTAETAYLRAFSTLTRE